MSFILLDPQTQPKEDAKAWSPADPQPHPASYDSGEEFSLAHFVHDCELVDQDEGASTSSALEDEYLPVA